MNNFFTNPAIRGAAFAFAGTFAASVITTKLTCKIFTQNDLAYCALAALVSAATVGTFILLSATFNPVAAGAIVGSMIGAGIGYTMRNGAGNENVLIGALAGAIFGAAVIDLYIVLGTAKLSGFTIVDGKLSPTFTFA